MEKKFSESFQSKSSKAVTSLAVHWLRICPAMQGARVPSLVGKLKSHMLWVNKTMCHMQQLLKSMHSAGHAPGTEPMLMTKVCALQRKILHKAMKSECAPTKTQHSQTNINLLIKSNKGLYKIIEFRAMKVIDMLTLCVNQVKRDWKKSLNLW